jgi:O-antigen ligase
MHPPTTGDRKPFILSKMQSITTLSAGFNHRSLGCVGLVIFAFFAWLGTAGSVLGACLWLIGILLNISAYWRSMRRQPLFWLSVLAIGYILLHWLLQKPLDEQSANYAERYSAGLIYLWLFSLIGWYLRRRDELARWLAGLAAIGLCIQVLLFIDWQNLSTFIKQRQDFGFSVAGAALICALSIWGLAFFGAFSYRMYSGWKKWGIMIVGSLGIVLLSESLIITQSRATWMALLVSLVFAGVLFVSMERAALKAANKRYLIIMAVMVTVLLSALLAANYAQLTHRITQESGVYKTLLSFDRSQIPYSSIGARAHMVLYGIELWEKKPWFGWGVGSSRSLLAMDEVLGPHDHPHFHNGYVEVLVEQGVFGFVFYLLTFVILMRGLFKAYSEGSVTKDMFYYQIGAWVMILVWSLADTRMVHVDLRFPLLLLSGMAFSVQLERDNSAVHERPC